MPHEYLMHGSLAPPTLTVEQVKCRLLSWINYRTLNFKPTLKECCVYTKHDNELAVCACYHML